tara:strand:+ start:411 stop:992 length:582 start_codon:yes stop_codon:yes gene_type:complete
MIYKQKIFIIVLTIFSFCYNEELTSDQINKIKEMTEDVNRAPNFSLKSVSDSLYVLDEMKGKVVLLNFWAIFCGPCRLEIPDFNDLYEKYNERGFEILGVSTTDTKQNLEKFLKAYKMDYPVLYGNSNEIQKVLSAYGGIYSIPQSFLINKKGEIIRAYPGAILKDYYPNMYADLIYNIESSLSENDKKDINR